MTLQVQVDVKGRNTNLHATIWVDMDKPFKVGDYITLKSGFGGKCKLEYEVLKIYSQIEKQDINHKWNVGGL